MTHDSYERPADQAPPCPQCAGATILKEIHRNSRDGSSTCIFRCVRCAIDYPRVVTAGAMMDIARIKPPNKGGRDGDVT